MDRTGADGAAGSYTEGSALVELLGSPGKVKMLDVFLGKHYEDLSATQVADLAGIDVSTFHRNVDAFLDVGVLVETRTVGGTQLYRLDTDHPVSKALGQTRSALLEYAESIDREADEDIEPDRSESVDSGFAEFGPDVVLDARDCIMGRVASEVAKRALDGERVAVVNAERAVITGRKNDVFETYEKHTRPGSDTGSNYPKRPDRIFKRSIRGMLPYKTERGREAFENVRVYVGNPVDVDGVTPEGAKLDRLSNIQFVSLGELSDHVELDT